MSDLKQPSTTPCKQCGGLLSKGRVLYSSSPYCIECDKTERKVAVKIIRGKNLYNQLEFTTAENAARYNKTMSRAGQSPGRGMKGQAKTR